jgi:hypothetical protein
VSSTEALQGVLLGVGLVFFALTRIARRRPDIAWLRPFNLPQLPAAQRERHRKRAERMAGIEFILLGLVLPLGYVILTMMTFSSIDPLWMTGTIVASVACIAAGIWAFVKNR